jgi:hypothetical protein
VFFWGGGVVVHLLPHTFHYRKRACDGTAQEEKRTAPETRKIQRQREGDLKQGSKLCFIHIWQGQAFIGVKKPA